MKTKDAVAAAAEKATISPATVAGDAEAVVAQVRDRYGRIALKQQNCCAPSCCGGGASDVATAIGYSAEALEAAPEGANLGLGCGAPISHLGLRPGETVLDLGSGAGIDCFLAAHEVGPRGRVIGVDMTPEMLARARENAGKTGRANVEFREGRLEALPVEDASVDAVTSNCVINLVPDKATVFREIARVLRPGGRVVVADIVLERALPEAVAKDVLAWCGCVSGAAPRHDYFAMVEAAGLRDVSILAQTDYASSVAQIASDQAQTLLERWGVTRESLEGAVMSVTWRAVKG